MFFCNEKKKWGNPLFSTKTFLLFWIANVLAFSSTDWYSERRVIFFFHFWCSTQSKIKITVDLSESWKYCVVCSSLKASDEAKKCFFKTEDSPEKIRFLKPLNLLITISIFKESEKRRMFNFFAGRAVSCTPATTSWRLFCKVYHIKTSLFFSYCRWEKSEFRITWV